MVSTPKRETESFAWPTSSVQGIQMWLKSVEPFDSIEDDFELVDEDTSSLDESSFTLESKPHVDLTIPKLDVEKSPNNDLDIWLKKEAIPLKSAFKHLEQDELLAAEVDETPKDKKVSPDTEIWIISQNKMSGKATVADYEMFNHLRQESDNLMNWVKKELIKEPDLVLEVNNPFKAWADFEKTIEWIHESNPDRAGSSSSLTSNGYADLWLHKTSPAINTSDTPNEVLKPEDTSYEKWLKKDNPLKQNEIKKRNPVCNWDNILRTPDKDSFAKFIKPTEKETEKASDDNPDKKWLLPNKDEQQPYVQIPFEIPLQEDDNNKWLYKEVRNSEKSERPFTFSFEQSGKWLYQKK